MTVYKWDLDKNKLLKQTRHITFNQILKIIQLHPKQILSIIQNPNVKYPHQQVYVFRIKQKAYLVPFVKKDDQIFMKTIYPSSKYTKLFIKNSKK